MTAKTPGQEEQICGWCSRPGEPGIGKRLLKCTRCNKVAYCNKECQRKDWKNHRPHCHPELKKFVKEEGITKLYGEDFREFIRSGRSPGRFGARVGIRNEGNTCYLNGVVQALGYSPLAQFLLSPTIKVSTKTTKHGFNLMHEFLKHVSRIGLFNESLAAREAIAIARQELALAEEMHEEPEEGSTEDSDDEFVRPTQEVILRPKRVQNSKLMKLGKNMIETKTPKTSAVSIHDTILRCTQHAGHMEDAHECLTYLLERLIDACAIGYDGKRDQAWEKSTIVYHLFGLDLAQLVTCQKCGHEIKTDNSEFMLRLNATLGLDPTALAAAIQVRATAQIKKQRKLFLRRTKPLPAVNRVTSVDGSDDETSAAASREEYESEIEEDDDNLDAGPTPTSVSELLKVFFAAEQLEGYACDHCKERDTSSKGLKFASSPESLALYIDRIPAFGADFGKLKRRVAINPLIDLDPFMATTPTEPSPYIYRLYAIVCHLDLYGSTFFGHYITYVSDDDGQWWCLDDESVTTVSWSFIKTKVNPDLLFYHKMPLNHPLVSRIRDIDSTAHAIPKNDSMPILVPEINDSIHTASPSSYSDQLHAEAEAELGFV